MGERRTFQPLTAQDRVEVLLYRTGIVLSALVVAASAYFFGMRYHELALAIDLLVYCLYISVGLSVFFIHLYVSAFKRFLIKIYAASLICLVTLLLIGRGSLFDAFSRSPYMFLLLLPVSGCLGFVTAKEAFCFRLIEGYLLAMLMPAYVIFAAAGAASAKALYYGLLVIAAMLVLFTLRKVFMPIAYDIGDKTAYH